MRRLDIGIASWRNHERLDETIRRLRQHCQTDYRVFVIDNASPDPEVRQVIERHAAEEPRIVPVFLETNTGYAGAVAHLQKIAETEYISYCDNDAWIETPGWDVILASYLDRFHEIGMIFPAGGAYPIKRVGYTEILWGVGCFWMQSRTALAEVGLFDTELGHQEEVDYQTRLRLAGFKSAQAGEVQVTHHASSTNNPAALERINKGIIRWVDKWERYFGGKHRNYFSDNVLRFELWPPTQLYMEDYWRSKLPGLNDNPEVEVIDGQEYDLIKVPRLKNFYRGRYV